MSQQSNDTKAVVFDYTPKEFPLVVSKSAKDFVSSQKEKATDFQISEIIAQQSGIASMQRKSLDDRVEEMALEKLKSIQEAAYKEAYELGLIEGSGRAFEEYRSQFEERMSKLDQILSEFDKMRTQLLVHHESEIIGLVGAIAKRIAINEVKADRETVVRVISMVLEEIQNVDKIVVKVSHDDLAFLESLRDKLAKKQELWQHLKLDSSDDIADGGAVIETEFGVVDARLEERVSRVMAAVEAKIPRLRRGDSGPSSDGGDPQSQAG